MGSATRGESAGYWHAGNRQKSACSGLYVQCFSLWLTDDGPGTNKPKMGQYYRHIILKAVVVPFARRLGRHFVFQEQRTGSSLIPSSPSYIECHGQQTFPSLNACGTWHVCQYHRPLTSLPELGTALQEEGNRVTQIAGWSLIHILPRLVNVFLTNRAGISHY